MTVEIAIMNLEAVALAADSAVTSSVGTSQKVFASQNKLFALSDTAPVGILVYGNASFMAIPWETVIKEYRRKEGQKTFARLSAYGEDFCRFLVEHIANYIDKDHQKTYMISLVRLLFREIDEAIKQRVSTLVDILAGDEPNRNEMVSQLIESVTTEIVQEYYTRARDAPSISDDPSSFLRSIRSALRGNLRPIRDEVFSRPLNPTVARRLNDTAVRTVAAFFDDVAVESAGQTTGIVVAGFGEEDLFPSFSEILVEGLVCDVLKQRNGRQGGTGPDNPVWIVPFAQADVIYQFMQGLAPFYSDYLHGAMVSHLDSYTDVILEHLDRYSDEDRALLREALQASHADIADGFIAQVHDVGARYLAGEIVEVVHMLPKDQLAEMAEALVSLTTLKRKVSLAQETVGGPTDVAVITKGDGLVWMRRKQYFPASLNPAYFARRYGGGRDYATEDTKE